MKRIGYLYEKIYDIDNLKLAHKRARRGKNHTKEVIEFCKNEEVLLKELHNILKNNSFNTSKYYVFTIYDPKEREIYKLPYYPDRILHHAVLNILEPIFVKTFISQTYNCIKKRGIHKGLRDLNLALKVVHNTKYCLKLDIKKFYQNINNKILRELLRKKFKDTRLLKLLDKIIESSSGVPIGNYCSQYFANYYLTFFDHYLKEELRVKYYFRYCDDIVILSDNKSDLHNLLILIKLYLQNNLNLDLKSNYQIFPVKARGIDFLGYKSYHTHILLRKSIKKRFIKMTKTNYNHKSINSYNGWLSHGNCINLKQKYIKNG